MNHYDTRVYGTPRSNRTYKCFRCGLKNKGRTFRFWHETHQNIEQNGCIPVHPECPEPDNRCEEIAAV
jgi:hypothetical protein